MKKIFLFGLGFIVLLLIISGINIFLTKKGNKIINDAEKNLSKAKIEMNEAAARAALNTVVTAEVTYRIENPTYATLSQLGSPESGSAYLPKDLGCAASPCSQFGYKFNVSEITDMSFWVTAVPEDAGGRSFCVTEDGIIRVNDKGEAIANRAACLSLPEAPRE